jgi:hypothetical protein
MARFSGGSGGVGTPGPQGPQGEKGAAVGLTYTYKSTYNANPGSGEFTLIRSNPSYLSTVTSIRLSHTVNGTDVSSIYDDWDNSTSTIKAVITFTSVETLTEIAQFTITGTVSSGAGYSSFNASFLGGSSTFTDGDEFTVQVQLTGLKGDQGGGGISNVVEDTTPQLGGNLDVNGNNIVSTGSGNIQIVTDTDGDVILTASGTGIVSVTGDLTVGGDVLLDGNLVGVYRIQPENNSMAEITIPADADIDTNPLTIYTEGAAGVEITGGLLLTPGAVTGDSTPANATIPFTQSVVMLYVADPSAAQFYLPDGTEGQILHLIPTSEATGDAALISLTIDNYRFIDGGGTAVIQSTSVSGNNFYPFSAGYTTAMTSMVFVNGAWVASQGQWT